MRAEASSIRGAADSNAVNAANAYAVKLAAYAGRIGKEEKWHIPRVGPELRVAACAVSESAFERLKLAVALYRDKHRALLSPDEKAEMETTAKQNRAREQKERKLRTSRNDVITKCAVRQSA